MRTSFDVRPVYIQVGNYAYCYDHYTLAADPPVVWRILSAFETRAGKCIYHGEVLYPGEGLPRIESAAVFHDSLERRTFSFDMMPCPDWRNCRLPIAQHELYELAAVDLSPWPEYAALVWRRINGALHS